jgi:glycosyltransferase involved in cell wall biosynthesis
VIGEGPFRSVLEEQILEAGLTGQAHLIGGQLPDEVAQWASTAQLLTLPSWTEGYPNVLVEALACGCPIVATDVGGIPEIVTPDRGLLVPARQSAALAKALVQVLSTPWDRLALAASMQRSWDDVARETLSVGLALGRRHVN